MKNLTKKETAVIENLREYTVATKKKLCDQLEISHMTLVRALKKIGYHRSYNKNSSFYTLQGIPDFDRNGLWAYKDVYFSQYITLEKTIISLVDRSDAGFTKKELERLLKTNVKNTLSKLISKNRVKRCYAGRYVVYLSCDRLISSKQDVCRKKRLEKSKTASAVQRQETKRLPENLDALTVIRILIQMIEFPSASVASISQSLQRQGFSVTAIKVRRVIEFYSLEKKRHTKHGNTGDSITK
jgi:hypothetical protein